MAITAAAIALVAADQAVKALGDGVEQLGVGGPEYLKSGTPESLPGKIGLAVGRQACRRYGDGIPGINPVAAARYETACRPYLDDLAYGAGPGLDSQFDGGQCPVPYLFTYRTSSTTGDGGPFQIIRQGPLSVVRVVTPSTSPGGISSISWRLVSGPNRFSEGLFGGGETFDPVLSVVSVVRTDNQPDTCGNPPPRLIDPVPPPAPGPPTEPFEPEPDVKVDINLTVNIDGTVEFNIGTGPIIINPFGGLGGGGGEPGDGDGDGGGDPDTSPPAPEPGPTNPGGNGGFGGDDEFGPPPAGRRWVGCCLTITNRPDNSGIIIGSEPEDVYPAVVGNVRLVLSASGSRQTDTPVRINAKKVCVWEPVPKLNPTGINVDLLPGFGYTFTPYSVPAGD